MQTIQELLTRGLDLDFNALGEILRVIQWRNPLRSLHFGILGLLCRCFFPPGCEQASVLWLAAANNDLEAFLERAASWVPAVFCWSCQHKQCRQGEETKGILVSRTHYVCLPIPFFTSQEIQHCRVVTFSRIVLMLFALKKISLAVSDSQFTIFFQQKSHVSQKTCDQFWGFSLLAGLAVLPGIWRRSTS